MTTTRTTTQNGLRSLGTLLATLLIAIAFASMTPAHAAASSSIGAVATGLAQSTSNGLVHKTHGRHCRARFGWDRRVGFHRWHRHRWACGKPRRCIRRNFICRDRWGGGWRYRRCMRRGGC